MQRSQAAFRSVFREHGSAVYAYCIRRTNPDDAVDATAEVFLIAWRRVEDMPDGDEALPWLYGVARRVLSRQWRSQCRRRRLVQRSGAMAEQRVDEPETVLVQREEYTLVRAALSRLCDADQEVLRLAAWDELPHATIAGLLGCSVNAVDQRIHRAKRRLAREYTSLERHGFRIPLAPRRVEEGGAP